MKKQQPIIVLISLAVLFVGLTCNTLLPPASWQQIHLGDSYADLKKEYPAVERGQGAIRVDRLIERRSLGNWVTYYAYSNDRISYKRLRLEFGLLGLYRSYDMASDGKE